jgi:beta-lactamase regulating signal transducer with metallopeptidase domain
MLLSLLEAAERDGPRTAAAADPLLFGLFMVIMIAIFVAIIFLLRYIYQDAVKKGLNAELWLIIILIAPPIGVILYFVVRNTERT